MACMKPWEFESTLDYYPEGRRFAAVQGTTNSSWQAGAAVTYKDHGISATGFIICGRIPVRWYLSFQPPEDTFGLFDYSPLLRPLPGFHAMTTRIPEGQS